jgi:hypothetical protein
LLSIVIKTVAVKTVAVASVTKIKVIMNAILYLKYCGVQDKG